MLRALLVSAVLLAACSSTSGAPTASNESDAAVDVEPETPPSEVGGSCNGVELGDAPEVSPDYGTGKLPVAEGGTFVDGTYVLTSTAVYGLAGRSPMRRVVAIKGDIAQESTTTVTLTDVLRRTAALTFDGTNVTFTFSCPSASTSTYGYTAKDTSFLLFEKVGSSTFVSTYTLR